MSARSRTFVFREEDKPVSPTGGFMIKRRPASHIGSISLYLAFFSWAIFALTAWPGASQNSGRTGIEKGPDGRDSAAREVLVKFRAGSGSGSLRGAEQSCDADLSEPIGDGRVHRLRSRSQSVAEMVARLSLQPDVEYA